MALGDPFSAALEASYKTSPLRNIESAVENISQKQKEKQDQQYMLRLLGLTPGSQGGDLSSKFKPELSLTPEGKLSVRLKESLPSKEEQTQQRARDLMNKLPTLSKNPTPEEREDFLNSLEKEEPDTASIVRGLGEYDYSPTDIGGILTGRQHALALTKKAYPDWSVPDYKQIYQTMQDIRPGGNLGQAKTSLNMLTGHLDQLYTAMQNLQNIDVRGVNALLNRGKYELGKKELQAAVTDALPVAVESEKYLKGSGITSQEGIDQWLQRIPINGSPAQQKAWFTELSKLYASRTRALESNVNQTLSKAGKKWEVLDDYSKKILDKYGIPHDSISPASKDTSIPSEDKIIYTMKKYNLSRDEVIKRWREKNVSR